MENRLPPSPTQARKRKCTTSHNGEADLPPYSERIEQAALCCLLIASETSWPEYDRSSVTADWFYDGRHREIFEIASDVRKDFPVDLHIIGDRLQKAQTPRENLL